MKYAVLIVLLGLAVSNCGGCAASSISATESGEPKRVYYSGEPPAVALGNIAVLADGAELLDQPGGRLVLSFKNPFLGHRISMTIVRAVADGTGARLSAWYSGVQPVSGPDIDKLWERYAAQLDSRGVEHRVIAGE
jgi:hypothetical protein